MSAENKDDGFLPWDFRDLHDSLVAAIDDDKRFKALLSNNHNVILAALKRSAECGCDVTREKHMTEGSER